MVDEELIVFDELSQEPLEVTIGRGYATTGVHIVARKLEGCGSHF